LLPAWQRPGGLALHFDGLILPWPVCLEAFCPTDFAPAGKPESNSVFRFGISKVDFCPDPFT
jgi:hypothetical protein